MIITTIESKNNKKIKNFINLSNSKKIRKKMGLCVLEGLRLVSDALKFGVSFKQVFVSNFMFNKLKLIKSPLLKIDNINLLNDHLSRHISSVKNTQGIFAIVSKPKNVKFKTIEHEAKILILVKLKDPGNIGTLIRSATAFGFETIVLADCCDVFNPKIIRSSMGSIFKTKFLECSLSNLKKWLSQTTLETIASVPNINKNKNKFLNHHSNHALIIGSEANGLSDDILKLCKYQITIKMRNNIESLNAAAAGSILMFGLSHRIDF